MDNIFIERLWRSLKYECVYLHAWSGGREAKGGINKWIIDVLQMNLWVCGQRGIVACPAYP